MLTGKPGTGKTTFARLVHKFLKAHGVLTGEFVEKNALELKGEYVGSTAPIVKQCFQEAKGGTLFLDEAYGLASDNLKGGGDSFSKEAVRTVSVVVVGLLWRLFERHSFVKLTFLSSCFTKVVDRSRKQPNGYCSDFSRLRR